jgi:hypothetical protein
MANAKRKSAPAGPAAAPGTHFVVERLNWRRESGATFYRLPGEVRVASFDSADEAEAYRREQEARARAVVNPFAGTLAAPIEQTSLPEGVLCDWLEDQGIEPPPQAKTSRRNWAKWWEKSAKKWSDDQREAIWARLDRVSFYRVVERPRRPVVYAVVRVIWAYNDEWYYPGAEGGETMAAYRSREKAEAAAAEMNEESQEEWTEAIKGGFIEVYEPAGLNQLDLECRLLPGQDPFGPPAAPLEWTGHEEEEKGWTFPPNEVPFYEVGEIELEGPG